MPVRLKSSLVVLTVTISVAAVSVMAKPKTLLPTVVLLSMTPWVPSALLFSGTGLRYNAETMSLGAQTKRREHVRPVSGLLGGDNSAAFLIDHIQLLGVNTTFNGTNKKWHGFRTEAGNVRNPRIALVDP